MSKKQMIKCPVDGCWRGFRSQETFETHMKNDHPRWDE